jgi:hypothetical protein
MIKRLWQRITSRFRRRSYSQAILEMKPVAFYPLNGATQDVSGNGYHATIKKESAE